MSAAGRRRRRYDRKSHYFTRKSHYFTRKSHYFTRPAHLDSPHNTPPKSPYSLIQETTYQEPWRLLLATILLNKTSGRVAIPVLKKILLLYPSPELLLADVTNITTLTTLLTPLGLHNTRARAIVLMTRKYIAMDWRYAKELPGIGKYGDDSYRIFCCGQYHIQPQDNKLNLYVAWLHSR